jgi:hypothetical protein
MEIITRLYLRKVAIGELIWLTWRESFESCLLERMGGDGLTELALTRISTVHWLEWDQFWWIR